MQSRITTLASAESPQKITAERAEDRSTLWNEAVKRDWEAFYRGVESEDSYFITDIEGEIPPGLRATIFRNGCCAAPDPDLTLTLTLTLTLDLTLTLSLTLAQARKV